MKICDFLKIETILPDLQAQNKKGILEELVSPASEIAEVDQEILKREKEILAEQARASGKPEEIIEKMVEGRLRKFYEESVLLEQVFVIDGETKVGKIIEKAAGDVGAHDPVHGERDRCGDHPCREREAQDPPEIARFIAGQRDLTSGSKRVVDIKTVL